MTGLGRLRRFDRALATCAVALKADNQVPRCVSTARTGLSSAIWSEILREFGTPQKQWGHQAESRPCANRQGIARPSGVAVSNCHVGAILRWRLLAARPSDLVAFPLHTLP